MRRPALQPEPGCAITIMIISHTLYSAQDCTGGVQSTCVQWGRGQVHAAYCTVHPRTALSPGQSLRVTQRYTLLLSVTQCHTVSHSVTCHTRDRVTRSVCVVLMYSERGSHGHIADIVAAYNTTYLLIYNWQVNALSVRRFSECLFLQHTSSAQFAELGGHCEDTRHINYTRTFVDRRK